MLGDVKLRFIGSKTELLDEIEDILVNYLDGTEETFLDLFAGSNSVAKHFKSFYEVYTNDLLYFSYVLAKATIENNGKCTFERLKKYGIPDPLEYLQNTPAKNSEKGFYEESFSPTGQAKRMYFTPENARKIDYIRETIEEWNDKDLLTEAEYYYLLACLIKAIPYVSNIAGVYGAFLKTWDKRALNPLVLRTLDVKGNNKSNRAYNKDALLLINEIEADIVYIDPPYNTRQYAPNYHVLETIALHDKPILRGVTGLRDYTDQKSDFAYKRRALNAMRKLLQQVKAKHIVLSYSSDGILSKEELIDLITNVSIDGYYELKEIPYRKYKSKIISKTDDLYEYLFYFSTKKRKKEADVVPAVLMVKEELSVWNPQKKLIKSPLNYVGGKYKLLPQILPLFPDNINTFLDLFSGGANVGINVNAESHVFNDINHKINDFFRYLQEKDINKILTQIEDNIKKYQLSKQNEKGFKKLRDDYNNNPNPIDLYTLVCYSYNYQFRFNNSLEYNNPFGRNRSHFSENMRYNLIEFTKKIQTINAKFMDLYFVNFPYEELGENDFVYADPPYLITTGSYNDGNRGFVNWTDKQEEELYEILDMLTEKNIRFALSNVLSHKGKTNQKLIEWSNKYFITLLNYSYNNSSYNSKGKSEEVLITNYNPKTLSIEKPKTNNIIDMQSKQMSLF